MEEAEFSEIIGLYSQGKITSCSKKKNKKNKTLPCTSLHVFLSLSVYVVYVYSMCVCGRRYWHNTWHAMSQGQSGQRELMTLSYSDERKFPVDSHDPLWHPLVYPTNTRVNISLTLGHGRLLITLWSIKVNYFVGGGGLTEHRN